MKLEEIINVLDYLSLKIPYQKIFDIQIKYVMGGGFILYLNNRLYKITIQEFQFIQKYKQERKGEKEYENIGNR